MRGKEDRKARRKIRREMEWENEVRRRKGRKNNVGR